MMAKTGQKLLSTLISTGYDEISHWTSSDGKKGLEILMLIIEKSLNPLLDESQRILAGPLITDLAVKVVPPPPREHTPSSSLTLLGKWGNTTSSPDVFDNRRNSVSHRYKTRIHPGPLHQKAPD